MDSDEPVPPPGGGPNRPCSCACLCCGQSSSPSATWGRTVKRKIEQMEDSTTAGRRHLLTAVTDVARVEIENEAAALREALCSHQQSVQDLYSELEEERNAAASAASEAMSMILRLQREKAESQMDARQFKRYAEEKMAHDQQEIAALEDLLFKREQAIQSLSCEVQAYKHRLMSYGINPGLSEPQTPDTATGTGTAAAAAAAAFDYPPLRCKIPSDLELGEDSAAADLEKYAFGETPRDLQQRIYQLERMPSSSHEKGVVGYFASPCHNQNHLRRFSVDSFGSGGSFLVRDQLGQEFPVAVDRGSDSGERDDVSDRVYTVDAVHGAAEDYVGTPREFGNAKEGGKDGQETEEGEIKKLYMRLQALEADRESMRQTIISMGTDKAQLVLLKEIAQQLCKEVAPPPPQKRITKKPSFFRCFSIVATFKWIVSFVFWRKKSSRIKYTFGISSNNAGLLLLLDKSTARMRHRRCLTRSER